MGQHRRESGSSGLHCMFQQVVGNTAKRSEAPSSQMHAPPLQKNSPSSSSSTSAARAADSNKAAVPELPEFDWKLTRSFNLALNNPPRVRPAKADFIRAEGIVVGVVLENEARAYPWILLANYHAANDTLAGQPIIVNICEACNGTALFL